MKFFITIFTSLWLFAAPVFATEVVMGAGANLVFDPAEITIVKEVSSLSHEELAFAPGDSFEITFPEAGDFNYVCGPHEGAGMTGVVHVQ